jgi:1-phosphatidylinositol-4-phosphate 5-kinase
MHRTTTNNTVIHRDENEVMKKEQKGEGKETELRLTSTVRSPSAERTGGMQGQTLPVVEELGEASSTGGRSGRSRERSRERNENGGNDNEKRPLTPSKDGATSDDRPVTPAKDYSPNGNRLSVTPPTGGVRKAVSRSSLEKELPPLPILTSPVEMNEKESAVS